MFCFHHLLNITVVKFTLALSLSPTLRTRKAMCYYDVLAFVLLTYSCFKQCTALSKEFTSLVLGVITSAAACEYVCGSTIYGLVVLKDYET